MKGGKITSKNFINAIEVGEGLIRKEYLDDIKLYLDDIKPYLANRKIDVRELISEYISSNILTHEELKHMCKEYNKEKDHDHENPCHDKCTGCNLHHIGCTLYKLGLLGWVKQDQSKADQSKKGGIYIQKFMPPDEDELDDQNGNHHIPHEDYYVLHPILNGLLKSASINKKQIVGRELSFDIKNVKSEPNPDSPLKHQPEHINQDNERDLLETHKNTDTPEQPIAKDKNINIFIVHGHDSGTMAMVKNFISDLKLKPILLHEQASEGKTISEKFENYSDVGYAIVLMTPDDSGSSNKNPDNTQKRARQNVIFELGYFIGKLGRKKVITLIKGVVDIPSDYFGVEPITIDDNEGWQKTLMKELKKAGYIIDANHVV